MTRTTRTTLVAGVATAGLSLGALVAPSATADPRGPQDHGVAERAEAPAAPQLRRPSPSLTKGKPPTPGKPTGSTARVRQQAIDTLTADGAIGVVARVDTPGSAWQGGSGVRERGTRAPAQGFERLRVASNTKPMIATLVMQEVAKGTWTLDTTIGEVRPGIFPGHDDVTIRQLLSHT